MLNDLTILSDRTELKVFRLHHSLPLQVSAQALTVYVSQAERALLYSLPGHTLLLTLHVSPDPPRGQTPGRQNSIF